MANPNPVLEVAWTSDVQSPPYKWRDCTHYVRDDQMAISAKRGRQAATGTFPPGQANLPLDNRARHFSPTNTSGPWFGYLDPLRPFRISMEFPGAPGLIPDPLNRAGVSQWSAKTNVSSIAWGAPAFDLGYGTVNVAATAGSLVQAHSAPVLVLAPQVGMRAAGSARVVAAGTSTGFRVSIQFYTDTAGTVVNGAQVDGASVTAAAGDEVRVTVGAVIPASTQSYRLILGCTTPQAGSVNKWFKTVTDIIGITEFFTPLFTGYTDGLPYEWDVADNIGTLTGKDAFKILGNARIDTPSYGKFVRSLATQPSHWFRFNETLPPQQSAWSVALIDAITGLGLGSLSNSTDTILGINEGPLLGVSGCSITDPDFALSTIGLDRAKDFGTVVINTTTLPAGGLTPWTIAFWIRSQVGTVVDGDPVFHIGYDNNQFGAAALVTTSHTYATVRGLGSGRYGKLDWNINDSVAGESHSTRQGTIDVVTDKQWHMIALTFDGTNYKGYTDGFLEFTELKDAGGVVLTGLPFTFNGIDGFDLSADDPGWALDELMIWKTTAIDATTISNLYTNAKLVYPTERSYQRAGKILDAASWPASLRELTTSGRLVQPVLEAFANASPVQYLQVLESSEPGLLFAKANGNVALVDYMTLTGDDYTVPISTWGTGVGELTYERVVVQNDDSLLYTQGQAQRLGGQTQYADDAAKQLRYGVRPTPGRSNLLLTNDDEPREIAQWDLDHFKGGLQRLTGLIINPLASEAVLAAFVALEIGKLIKVRVREPGQVGYTEYTVQIQGITNTITRKKWRAQLDLADQYGKRYFRVGDTLAGTYTLGL